MKLRFLACSTFEKEFCNNVCGLVAAVFQHQKVAYTSCSHACTSSLRALSRSKPMVVGFNSTLELNAAWQKMSVNRQHLEMF